MQKKKASAITSYNKWGYFFLIPFIVIFLIFQLIPLVSTVLQSFSARSISLLILRTQ